MIKPIFTSAPDVFKNDTRFISGPKWLENNHFTLLVYIRGTLCTMITSHYNTIFYRVFQEFGQAKFLDGSLV